MGTKETLRRRSDIPDAVVEELIAQAALLQDQDQSAKSNTASVGELTAVAAELDIDPKYVEQAISQWRNASGQRIDHGTESSIVARRKKTLRILAIIGGLTAFTATIIALLSGALFGFTGMLIAGVIGITTFGLVAWLLS
jgi:hypothetical protein